MKCQHCNQDIKTYKGLKIHITKVHNNLVNNNIE